jgi:hypothetical protein
MENLFIITPETFDYSPDCDRPEPDSFNLQIGGLGRDDMFQAALEDLIELNTGVGPVRSFRLDFNKHNLKFFTPKSQRDKIPLAA